MAKVRWGVLSTAKIGVRTVIPAMQKASNVAVVAIASRSLARAQAAAAELGIPQAFGSYEALLASPEVDAVYIPVPNHQHVPLSLLALEAGKHVLCEKPIALTAGEARTLLEAARARPQLKVMEAFMYRHHPQWQHARAVVQGGGLGQLRTIQAVFSYFNRDPANVRNMADIGGGGLLDIGCYTVSQARFLFGREPRRVVANVERDPEFGVDRLSSALLDFGSGTATFTVSTQLTPYQRVTAFGTEGSLEIEIPFNAPLDGPMRVWHRRGAETVETIFDHANQYTIQGELMSAAILADLPVPTPLEDAVANMNVIDAVFRSGADGGWVEL